MLEMFRGLPAHVLIVHAVVVLVPIAAVAVLALAVRPAWRRTYGPLVGLVTTCALLAVVAARQSGIWLRGRLDYPDGDFRHGELGERVIWYAVPFWLLTIGFLVLERRRASAPPQPDADGSGSTRARQPWPVLALAVAAVLVGLGTTAQVVRTGESGVESVWIERLQ